MSSPDLKEEDGDISGDALSIGVSTVALAAYRNYPSLYVELGPRFNVIHGPNAQGKTNFLEALYLLSTTRLLRGQRDAEAILDGHERASASAELLDTRTLVGVTLERGVRKRATLNGVSLPRASDLIGRLPCVCVSAIDLEIVRGEPTERRLFLDLELSGLYPAYLRHLTLYKRALEQRNALLRDSREWMRPPESFEPWEIQLARHGIAIREARRAYVANLLPHAVEAHRIMGAGEALDVRYVERDEAPDEGQAIACMAASRSSDVARGGTSIGPHRDDLALEIDGREARLFGSQGQQRTLVVSLKLATLEIGRRELIAPPLLLLDDVFSDLDERRRSILVEIVLARAGQAVLTATDVDAAGEAILREARRFEVCAGSMREA